MLDGVGARLVKWIAGLHVVVDLEVVVAAHGNFRDAHVGEQPCFCEIQHRDAGIDLVGMTAQQPEHVDGLGGVGRLAE